MSLFDTDNDFADSYLQSLQQAFAESQLSRTNADRKLLDLPQGAPEIDLASCSHTLDGGRPCSNRGKLHHKGRWYCGHHHPDVLDERRKRREARWAARLQPLPAGQACLQPEQLQALGLPLLSCGSCQNAALHQLEKVVRALEPYEGDGKLPIPGLESLWETRNVLARARNGLLAKPAACGSTSTSAASTEEASG